MKKHTCLYLAFIIILLMFHLPTTIAIADSGVGEGVRHGLIYRIKNAYTGEYLTVLNTSASVGVGMSMSPRTNTTRQLFQLSYMYPNGYSLTPQCNTMYHLGANSSQANTSGTAITLQTASSNYKIIVTRNDNGSHRLSLAATTSGLFFRPATTATGAGVIIKPYISTGIYDWIFEPYGSEDMHYFPTCSGIDTSTVSAISSNFETLGYTVPSHPFPVSIGQIYSNSTSGRSMVFHDHGGPGYILVYGNNNEYQVLYSEKLASDSSTTQSLGSISNYIWSGYSFVMFVSCQSARREAGTDRLSLAEAAYKYGATCVIGFYNNVAGGEDYLNVLSYAIQTRPTGEPMTIADAVYAADFGYSAIEKAFSNCPANPNNLRVIGNSSVCIDMRMN